MEQLDTHQPVDSIATDAVWSVLIYQTTSAETQQEILLRAKSFCPEGMPMLGASSGPEYYVIVECSNEHEQHLIERTVSTVDRCARLMHTASPWSQPRLLRSPRHHVRT